LFALLLMNNDYLDAYRDRYKKRSIFTFSSRYESDMIFIGGLGKLSQYRLRIILAYEYR